jgi:hypothetical protein
MAPKVKHPKIECTNAKVGAKPKFYPMAPTVTSPKAKGYCARHAKVGFKMKGTDNKDYVVAKKTTTGTHYWRLVKVAKSPKVTKEGAPAKAKKVAKPSGAKPAAKKPAAKKAVAKPAAKPAAKKAAAKPAAKKAVAKKPNTHLYFNS